jgi:DNA modification methylase
MSARIIIGDCRQVLKTLPDASVHCVVTSPPYFGLRDYGVDGQIGLEQTPADYVAEIVAVFREVRRVLRDDGTLWLNLGDSYCSIGHKKSSSGYGSTGLAGGKAQEHTPLRRENSVPGLKHKDLIGIPWRVAFALQADGWYLRQDIIWSKLNPMPESVTDRCTKAHEYIFLLSKSARYHFDAGAIAEIAIGDPGGNVRPTKGAGQDLMRTRNGLHLAQERARQNGGFETRNKRSVWEVATAPFSEAHFATFPPALIEPCINAGCPKDGTVLDPFSGAGTTGLVADRLGRNAILIELNPAYAEMSHVRHVKDAGMFADVSRDVVP